MTHCNKPPPGWACQRVDGHPGPCAAAPITTKEDKTWWMKNAAGLLLAGGHDLHATALATLAEGIDTGRVVSAPPDHGQTVILVQHPFLAHSLNDLGILPPGTRAVAYGSQVAITGYIDTLVMVDRPRGDDHAWYNSCIQGHIHSSTVVHQYPRSSTLREEARPTAH